MSTPGSRDPLPDAIHSAESDQRQSNTDCATCGPIAVAYYRSATGEMVHRAECARRGKGSIPWHYAARRLNNNHARVLAEIESIPWLKGCGYCMAAVECLDALRTPPGRACPTCGYGADFCSESGCDGDVSLPPGGEAR